MMKSIIRLLLFLFILTETVSAQVDTAAKITIDFNDHSFREKNGKIIVEPVEVSLVEDRFGNERQSAYVQGSAHSWLNLGASPLLKPKEGTISLWVKLDREVYAGKGYEGNPIIMTKNSPAQDFYDAYVVFYDLRSKRFMSFTSRDSTGEKQVGINSLDIAEMNKWYHMVLAYNNENMWFYIDGVLQGRCEKGFETKFYEPDPVMVGNGAHRKNDRWMRGSVDDIRIFHRVLSNEEVQELYNAPNPNRFKRFLKQAAPYALMLIICGALIALIIVRNRISRKRERERLELQKHIAELEMKVVKTQMNPHFIANCLAAIQDLIYSGHVDKAGQYLAKFSLFLRKILDYSDKTYISLKEELEIIELNIELEQLRFKDHFELHIQIDPVINIHDIMVPSLITQPLIENAIWHGLLPLKERVPCLRINVYLKENSVYIEIEDNGVGRKKEDNGGEKKSRGTKLVTDKLEIVSKLTESANYKLQIDDLLNEDNSAKGTRIVLQLDSQA
jgi:two-component sensor histidine kinase